MDCEAKATPFLITGMGNAKIQTHLAIYTQNIPVILFINAGICGAFNKTLKIGDVLYQISSLKLMATLG